MPHVATWNMKITLSSTLQNIFQIDVHLWRNLLFLHRSLIYCTLNTSDAPGMATFAEELLFTFGMFQISSHPEADGDTDITLPGEFTPL